jgi:hypothetical protein
VNYYNGKAEDIKDSTNRYLLVDDANEKRKGNDYTAMWVVGLGQDENIYVLDLVRDRLNLTERSNEVMRLHRKWKPREVRYEKYGMMADIDHGDVSSSNPDDFNPYAWARAVPRFSPIIHIKQSLMDKGGHRPFTPEYNAKGRIQPQPLLDAFREGGGVDNEICLELSFKEREPDDRQVIRQIAESVAFWAPHINSGAADLKI